MTEPKAVEAPNRIPWPPILMVGSAAFAMLANRMLPGAHLVPNGAEWPGAATMLAGLGFDAGAMLTMRRYRANILPHRAATALVTAWPFSWSRNPIYLGNTMMLAGAALALRNPWFLVAAAFEAVAVTGLAIKREERHLDRQFGAAWRAYAAKVPRWLFSSAHRPTGDAMPRANTQATDYDEEVLP